MFPDTAWTIVLLVLSIPAYLALSRVHGDSRRRSIRATDEMVVTDLIRVKDERSLEIERDAFLKRLTATRDCENRVYGYMPGSDHPEQLTAVVDAHEAEQHLDTLIERTRRAEQEAEKRRTDLEHHLEEERERIQRLNRGFRSTDRILAASAAVLRVCLVIVFLYTLIGLIIDPLG